jgi:hypothetical protein
VVAGTRCQQGEPRTLFLFQAIYLRTRRRRWSLLRSCARSEARCSYYIQTIEFALVKTEHARESWKREGARKWTLTGTGKGKREASSGDKPVRRSPERGYSGWRRKVYRTGEVVRAQSAGCSSAVNLAFFVERFFVFFCINTWHSLWNIAVVL